MLDFIYLFFSFPKRQQVYCVGEQGGYSHSWSHIKGSVATYRSCVLLPGIQGTSKSSGGLGIFVLYPESMKLDNTQVDIMSVSEDWEVLNIYSRLLTAQLFISHHSPPKSF